jgi:hypothetical protein
VAVFEKTASGVSLTTLQPPSAADYVTAPDHGTLFIRSKKHPLATNPSIQTSRWNPGSQYIVAVRGGPNGLRTQGGGAVNPSATFYLLLLGKDLSQPQNETWSSNSAARSSWSRRSARAPPRGSGSRCRPTPRRRERAGCDHPSCVEGQR